MGENGFCLRSGDVAVFLATQPNHWKGVMSHTIVDKTKQNQTEIQEESIPLGHVFHQASDILKTRGSSCLSSNGYKGEGGMLFLKDMTFKPRSHNTTKPPEMFSSCLNVIYKRIKAAWKMKSTSI